jgi:uncharacterized protein YcbX
MNQNSSNTLKVTKVIIYPVKSMAGYEVPRARCTQNGLEGDRSFVVTRPDGRFLTARQFPKLLTLRPVWNADNTAITIEGPKDTITVEVPDAAAAAKVQIWNDTAKGLDCGDTIADWLSGILNKDVRLMSIASDGTRVSESNAHAPNSFADAMPLLILSQESLDLINQHLEESVTWENFRPNLLVSGLKQPFEEDYWHSIITDGTELQMAHGCTRCVMTTINQATGEFRKNREPMRLLKTIRRAEDKQIYVGQNAFVLAPGILHAGASVTVTETRENNILAP